MDDQTAIIPESPPLQPQQLDDGALLTAHLAVSQFERSKYTSPAPLPTSSITPPPSSQVPQIQKHVLRTPSPPLSHLTSPPPTNRPFAHTGQVPLPTVDLPTMDEVENASMEELRSMVDHLSVSLREARASAAHFKLQHNMLLIDSTEANKRMEVELQLTQREVEVLQEAEERRRQDYVSPAQQAGTTALIEDLNRQCMILQAENEQLRESLAHTVQTLEDTDSALANTREENSRLRHRIRTNREHMNGILDTVADGSPRSLLGTPYRASYHNTPRHVQAQRSMIPAREPGAFEALLLADKVLTSQENATAPSTPKAKHQRLGHTRNTHSLSSLPSTPSRRLMPPTSALRTPPHLTAIPEPQSVGRPLPPHFSHTPSRSQQRQRRRASSDSTISASSVEEAGQSRYANDLIGESQASQRASQMLRRTPKSSFEGAGSQKKLTQSRITGKVTKPGLSGGEAEKRRLTSFGGEGMSGSPSKKGRVQRDDGPVGLGIGLPGQRY